MKRRFQRCARAAMALRRGRSQVSTIAATTIPEGRAPVLDYEPRREKQRSTDPAHHRCDLSGCDLPAPDCGGVDGACDALPSVDLVPCDCSL
jgi:hypothetical protein